MFKYDFCCEITNKKKAVKTLELILECQDLVKSSNVENVNLMLDKRRKIKYVK